MVLKLHNFPSCNFINAGTFFSGGKGEFEFLFFLLGRGIIFLLPAQNGAKCVIEYSSYLWKEQIMWIIPILDGTL